jgi:hypothetical protein
VAIDPPAVQAIRHLLDDPEISEIMINGLGHLFVERGGLMHELPPIFVSRQQIEGQELDGRVVGRFVCTGERPAFFDKLRRVGGESVDKARAASARRPDAA